MSGRRPARDREADEWLERQEPAGWASICRAVRGDGYIGSATLPGVGPSLVWSQELAPWADGHGRLSPVDAEWALAVCRESAARGYAIKRSLGRDATNAEEVGAQAYLSLARLLGAPSVLCFLPPSAVRVGVLEEGLTDFQRRRVRDVLAARSSAVHVVRERGTVEVALIASTTLAVAEHWALDTAAACAAALPGPWHAGWRA